MLGSERGAWRRFTARAFLAAATAYFALACVATSTESIAFGLLLVAGVLHWPALLSFWRGRLRSAILLLLVAWMAWSLLSLLWSSDPSTGRQMVKGMRGILLILLIAPLSAEWALLLSALLAGLAVQGMLQVLQLFAIVPTDPTITRFAGLASHPGMLGVAHAIGVVVAASWLVEIVRRGRSESGASRAVGRPPLTLPFGLGSGATGARRWALILLVVVLVLCSVGLGISAARAAMVALVVALPLTLAAQLWSPGRPGRTSPRAASAHSLGEAHPAPTGRDGPPQLPAIASAAAIVLLSIGFVFGLPALLGARGFAMQFAQFRNVEDAGSSAWSRLVYWSGALDAWRSHPVLGVGAGGTRQALERTDAVQQALARHPERDIGFFAPEHPHSIYVQTLLEQGMVGLLILGALLAAILRQSLRRCRLAPMGAAIFGALLVWAVAGAFDALHVSGRMASLACALLGLTWPFDATSSSTGGRP